MGGKVTPTGEKWVLIFNELRKFPLSKYKEALIFRLRSGMVEIVKTSIKTASAVTPSGQRERVLVASVTCPPFTMHFHNAVEIIISTASHQPGKPALSAIRLWFWLADERYRATARRGHTVTATRSDALAAGLSRAAWEKGIKVLESANLIKRGAGGEIHLSPVFVFNGRTEELAEARAAFDLIPARRLVARRKGKGKVRNDDVDRGVFIPFVIREEVEGEGNEWRAAQ